MPSLRKSIINLKSTNLSNQGNKNMFIIALTTTLLLALGVNELNIGRSKK